MNDPFINCRVSGYTYQVTISYALWFLRYSPDKILQVNTARSNQNHAMTMHINTPKQGLYQVSTSCTLSSVM